MKKFSLIYLIMLLLAACSVSEDIPRQKYELVTVGLTPINASLAAGGEMEFTAAVLGIEDTSVAWTATGGSLAGIGSTVVYTAPDEVGAYSVTATSAADPSISATATVTVEQTTEHPEPENPNPEAPNPEAPNPEEPNPEEPKPLYPDPEEPASAMLEPASATLATGTELALHAELTGITPDELVWQATGGTLEVSGTNATYQAPDTPGDYLITISSTSDPDLNATTQIHVPGGLSEPFTMVVLPDTQNMIQYEESAPLVTAMTEWIVQQRDVLGIGFVTHVGDIVSFADREPEWQRANAALSLLDGQVAYSVAFGDHEYAIEENKGTSTEGYRRYFGSERYADYSWYGGDAPNGLSHYQIFEAGGRRFLHIALEWEPSGPASDPSTPLGWARTLLEAHPELPTIITTHAYLWDSPGNEGRFPDSAREGYIMDGDRKVKVGSSGETIFRELVAPFPQVFMVVNGHYHRRPSGDPDDGEYHQVSLNNAGKPVFEMLSNYQSWSNGGDGWLRIVEFVPGGGEGGLDRIEVQTYSPPLDRYQTDAGSAFSFDLSFAERFAR